MRNLIKVWIVLMTIGTTVYGQNDFIDSQMKTYKNNSDFSHLVLTMGGDMVEGVLKEVDFGEGNKNDLLQMIKNLEKMQLLTTEKEGSKYYKEVLSKIDKNNYEVLMMVKEKDSKVRVWSRKKGNKIEEILLLVGEEDSFVLLSFSNSKS